MLTNTNLFENSSEKNKKEEAEFITFLVMEQMNINHLYDWV